MVPGAQSFVLAEMTVGVTMPDRVSDLVVNVLLIVILSTTVNVPTYVVVELARAAFALSKAAMAIVFASDTVELIVILSLIASAVIVILLPASRVRISPVVSATINVPLAFTVPKEFEPEVKDTI